MISNNLEKTKKIYRCFFIVVFLIANFNALLQIYVTRLVLTGLYLLLLGYAVMKSLYLKIPITYGSRTVFIYILWNISRFLLQVIQGALTNLSFISFAQTIVPVFAFFIAVQLNDDDAVVCEKYFLVSALISVLMSFINQNVHIIPEQYFANELVNVEGLIYNRFYSMSGYSLGTGWMSGVAIALLLGSGSAFIRPSILKIFAYLIFVASIVLTFSRGGFFFTLIIILVCITANFSTRKKIRTKRLFAIMVSSFAVVVVFVLFWNRITLSAFYSRYVLNSFDNTSSLRGRFQSQAVRLIKLCPFLGRGYGFVGTMAYASGIGEGFPPENNYFLIAINTGIIGVLLFIMSTVVLIIKNSRQLFGERVNSRVTVYIGIVIGALAWSLMSTPLEGDINTMMFWYSMGRIASIRY